MGRSVPAPRPPLLFLDLPQATHLRERSGQGRHATDHIHVERVVPELAVVLRLLGAVQLKFQTYARQELIELPDGVLLKVSPYRLAEDLLDDGPVFLTNAHELVQAGDRNQVTDLEPGSRG